MPPLAGVVFCVEDTSRWSLVAASAPMRALWDPLRTCRRLGAGYNAAAIIGML